jgi:hypothetical protein
MDIDNYFILVPVPIAVLILVSLVGYFLGLRPISAIGLGLLVSLVTIIVLHPFHATTEGSVIQEPGNFFVSIYILLDILTMLFLLCYNMCKKKDEGCCCIKNPSGGLIYMKYDAPSNVYTSGNNIKIDPYTDNPTNNIDIMTKDEIAQIGESDFSVSNSVIDKILIEESINEFKIPRSIVIDIPESGFIPAPDYTYNSISDDDTLVRGSIGEGKILVGSISRSANTEIVPERKISRKSENEVTYVTAYSSEDSFNHL